MKKVIIAGGSGFIGRELCQFLLRNGYVVSVLTRRKSSVPGCKTLVWNGKDLGDWANEFNNTFAVINLSGKRVDCRLTEENKKEILDSRIHSIEVLNLAISKCQSPPAVFVQAGAMGVFGDSKEHVIKEDSLWGDDFFAKVASECEVSFLEGKLESTRKIILRIPFVLSRKGGVLPRFEKLVRSYLGGKQGSGEQYICWGHIEDVVRCFLWGIESLQIHGAYNLAADIAIKNSLFMSILRRNMRIRRGLPLPSLLIRFVCKYILRTDPILLLGSRNASSQKLGLSGFEFKFKNIEDALKNLYRKI